MVSYAAILRAFEAAPVPAAKMKLVADAIYSMCDEKDGVKDGVITVRPAEVHDKFAAAAPETGEVRVRRVEHLANPIESCVVALQVELLQLEIGVFLRERHVSEERLGKHNEDRIALFIHQPRLPSRTAIRPCNLRTHGPTWVDSLAVNFLISMQCLEAMDLSFSKAVRSLGARTFLQMDRRLKAAASRIPL